MKLARIIAALWSLSGGCLAAQTPVAYDGFDYLKGGCLAGGATGSGWLGPWGEAGESGNAASEFILGPGSFPVPPGSLATSGHHVDLNQLTGNRRITRRMNTTLGGGGALQEHHFSFTLDFGPAQGIDYAGIELSHSAGGPVIFLGKPPGAGPGSPGIIGIDIYGQGFTGTGVAGSGQKHLLLRWSPNPGGPETLTLIVSDATSGAVLGTALQTAEFSCNQVSLVARRDLTAGGAVPAFDEIRASTGAVQTRTLGVNSLNPTSGVPITLSPADGNGTGNGDTSFERVYPLGTSVTLTAPATASGNIFSKWTLGGADHSTRRAITLSMTEDRALAAVFVTPPPPTYTLSVSASGAGGPVDIGVSPADQGGLAEGVAPFARSYVQGTTVTLTAPAIVGGTVFDRWTSGGNTLSTTASVEVTMNVALSLTAVYVTPPPPARILSVASVNPSAGVVIGVAPDDLNGEDLGTTPFSRSYANGSSVTLTAPEIPGMIFGGWQRDGIDFQASRTVIAALDADHAFTAIYDYPFDEKITSLSVQEISVHLTWSSIGGRGYVVEACSDLLEGFQSISEVIVAEGQGRTTSQFIEAFETRPAARFYRIAVQPEP